MRYASMQTALCAVIIALFLILKEYADSRKEKVKKMADLIDRDDLKQTLLELGFYPAIVKSALENAQAVDAVPVVRCKDCKQYRPGVVFTDLNFCYRLVNTEGILYSASDDDFCSYGERKIDG